MRSAAIAFLVGLIVVAVVGLTQRSSLVYSLGVNPASIAVKLGRGDRACQAPVRPPRGATFDRVGFLLGTYGKPGPQMRVEVLDDRSGHRLAGGRLAAGYADLDRSLAEHVVEVGRVTTSAPLRLCLVDEGRRPVGVVGQVGIASPPTSGTLNGTAIPNDLTFNLRGEDRSVLALLPDVAERASRFRAAWVTPGVYLLLAIALVIGGPLLLTRAIGRVASDGDPASMDDRPPEPARREPEPAAARDGS